MRKILGLVSVGALLVGCGQGSIETTESEQSPKQAMVETLATGANIAGTNGLHFGPDGLLYVTSVIGSDISVIDPDSGEIVERFTAADGVFGPDDVAFASDGSFYWTSILTGEVAGFDENGNRVVAAQLSPGSNPITFSDDDRLFVSQCFLGDGLYELDPSGAGEPRLIADDLGPGCGLNGMDWGPDGRLYGPRWFAGEVVSYNVDTGDRRTEATGFVTPAAIKFDSQGVLHVLDTGAGELIKVSDGQNEVIASFDPGLDNFAFDENDIAYVTSFTDGFVKRVNSDGSITDLQPGGLSHPGGVAIIGDTVWVADLHALRSFDRVTGKALETQRNIVGVGELGGSLNISTDGDTLILSSWFDGDVRVWDPVRQERLSHYPGLAAPVAAVRFAEGVAIAEHATGSVSLYSDDAEPVVLARGLTAPTDLYSIDGALYVSDRVDGVILKIADDGLALSEPELIAGNLDSPEGFVVFDDGILVVEAEIARITLVELSGNRRILAEYPAGSVGAPGLPPSQMLNGLALDSEGQVFFADETGRKLNRIRLE